ncbi:MAG: DUF1592 domain-containing protein [Bradymonadaceae bacterium]|nr:DUF1592 domain-containing protein [Lujinxingiaceae bacterium]
MKRTLGLLAALCATLILGCFDGSLTVRAPDESTSPDTHVDPGTADAGADIDPTINPDFPDLPCEGAACRAPEPSAPPRFTRLTHEQWENTMRDLLRLDARPNLSTNFLPDPDSAGSFNNNSAALDFTASLWDSYRVGAETLARQVATSPEALARIMPADAPDVLDARARAFIEHVGKRAYRRPLGEDEIARHLEIFAMAEQLMGEGDAFVQGVELLLRVFLQSPHFVFRSELTHSESAPVVALNAYERAAKLSFSLWSTMPDDLLFEAAAAGELDQRAGLERHARRMINDARAEDTIVDFHSQLLHFDAFRELAKDAERFPEFNADVAQAMRKEMELFIKDIIFEDEAGDLSALYLSPHSFVNAPLAAIYGLPGEFDEEFKRVDLDPRERAGLLTRLGFLSTHANAYEQSSIKRGVFVNLHVLCNQLGTIPDDIGSTEGAGGHTNRERITANTAGCGGTCHNSLINPAGFAFENYNALGRYQEVENGYPVDATGIFHFRHGTFPFQNSIEFNTLIAQSPDAHDCYTRHWFEFAYGRSPTDKDEPLIARISQASEAGLAKIRDMLVLLVVNDIFVTRSSAPTEETE